MGRRGERPMVPDATFTSYYGQPIINAPVWKAADIAGYLFLGGLAGASSVVALAADVSGRSGLARVAKVGALGAISTGAVGLVHDLGRPSRFVNMLRVFKPTSPMSVGSWLLAAYGPAAAVSAGSAATGLLPGLGTTATVGAAVFGPFVATYTGALISDTSVPAWHEGYREMPFLFASSAMSAAGGLGLLAAPVAEVGPARALSLVGAAGEIAAAKAMERRLGEVGEPYRTGKGGGLLKAAEALTAVGAVAAVTCGRSRLATRFAGMAMLAASAMTRFGIFEAGMESARDPKYTVKPQRARLGT